MKMTKYLCLGLVLGFFNHSLQAGQYFLNGQDHPVGATNMGDGSQLFSTALGSVGTMVDGTYKELQLTADGSPNVTSAFLLPDLDPGHAVQAFSVKWNSQIYADFAEDKAADGCSLSFGQVRSLDLTSGNVETGYGTGLCFSVQTYADGSPGFYIYTNGSQAAAASYDPLVQWGNYNGHRHLFEVDWNATNGLSVTVDGVSIFSQVPTTGFTPLAGDSFVWAARCGTLTEEVRLENIVAFTGGNLVPVPTASPYYFSTEDTDNNHTADQAFDDDINTDWNGLGTTGSIGASVEAAVVGAYVLTTGNDPAQNPQAWTLQGSNDGSSWNDCGTGNGLFLNPQESRAWPATNTTPYGAYQLNITQNNGNADTSLAELHFYQFIPISGPAANIPWRLSNAPTNLWISVASSADGNKLAAAPYSYSISQAGPIYLSTNMGMTWQPSTSPSSTWARVVSSADGTKLFAAALFESDGSLGLIHVSTNAGVSWQTGDAPASEWGGLAVSADGKKLVAVVVSTNSDPSNPTGTGGPIYVSTNTGASWFLTTAPIAHWNNAASSADGNHLLAVNSGDSGSGVYVSTNAGMTWTDAAAPLGKQWTACASSADGRKLVIASFFAGSIYISTNAGVSWVPSGAPADNWYCIASSGDGNKLAAGTYGGLLYTSVDGGLTWQAASAPAGDWLNIASSADGNELAASYTEDITSPGSIYTWQLPVLKIIPTAGNLTLSWTTNLTGISLQQSADLNSPAWTTVTATPAVINDQYQLTLPTGSGNRFFRLGSSY